MEPNWDDRSLRSMRGIHPTLRRVIDTSRAASPVGFVVIEGLRNMERQRELVAQGFSRTMNSKHLTGHAVDIWPIDPNTGKLVNGRDDKRLWELYRLIAPVIKEQAANLGVKVTWGGDWKSIKDGPHFEIDPRVYPMPGPGENLFREDYEPAPAPIPAPSSPAVPVLRKGSKGEAVRALQTRLRELHYFPGKIDGDYGDETKAAVMKFQGANGLIEDGIYGKQTRDAMKTATPRAERDVAKADLEESRTMQNAKAGKRDVTVLTTIGTVSTAAAAGQQVQVAVEQANSLIEALMSASPWLIAVVAVLVVAFLVYRRFTKAEEIRLDDARTGANISR